MHGSTMSTVVMHSSTMSTVVMHGSTMSMVVMHGSTMSTVVTHSSTMSTVMHGSTMSMVVMHSSTMSTVVIQVLRILPLRELRDLKNGLPRKLDYEAFRLFLRQVMHIQTTDTCNTQTADTTLKMTSACRAVLHPLSP